MDRVAELVAVFAISAAIIVGPMLLTRRKAMPTEYEERPFLNGTLYVPKD